MRWRGEREDIPGRVTNAQISAGVIKMEQMVNGSNVNEWVEISVDEEEESVSSALVQ